MTVTLTGPASYLFEEDLIDLLDHINNAVSFPFTTTTVARLPEGRETHPTVMIVSPDGGYMALEYFEYSE